MPDIRILLKLCLAIALSGWLAACGSSSDDDDDDDDDNANACGVVVEIGPSSVVNGRLEDGDCRVSDLDPGSVDASFVDEYRVTLSAPATLTITMRSTEIDSFLVLLDTTTSCASGCAPIAAITLAADDDSGGGVNGFDAQIVIALPAGTYIIVANSFLPETGNYTLETSFI